MGSLVQFRNVINSIDDEIVTLVARRLNICRDVAAFKKDRSIAMMQPGRVEQVKARCAEWGLAQGLRPEFVYTLYELIIDEACLVETDIIAGTVRQ